MASLKPASVHAVVTDPPYGLSFMGKRWDYDVPSVAHWAAVLRLLRPGGHLLSFGGARTYHRMVVNMEDAGFEVRDQVMWLYGSGFPKSLDVGKAIDKKAGVEREVVATVLRSDKRGGNYHGGSESRPPLEWRVTIPATAEARRWDGWGTALKPAHEPICLARKPLEGTVAANVLAHGCGGLNVAACRLEGGKKVPASPSGRRKLYSAGLGDNRQGTSGFNPDIGRWPANVVLDFDVAIMLDAQSGELTSGTKSPRHRRNAPRLGHGKTYGNDPGAGYPREWPGDSGGASRFFYCAKASPTERGPGNDHPTVKPLALMQWLVRLVCPPGGVVLDPFLGSGTTALACEDLGLRWIGIEREEKYCEVAKQRLIGRAPLFAGVAS
jgi:site-specific DNA-methyltransferase (adenine-specific)